MYNNESIFTVMKGLFVTTERVIFGCLLFYNLFVNNFLEKNILENSNSNK